MSSISPEPDLVIDRDRAIPGTWTLCGGLLLTHILTAVVYASTAKISMLQALLGDRGLRMRIAAGGQYRPFVEDGEGWRLLRSIFLHVDGLHLLTNVVAIGVIGRMLEPWVGAIRLWFWFLLAGTAGSLASHGMGLMQSDGASGGAFGLFGALMVLAIRNHARLVEPDRQILLVWLPLFLLGNLILSFAIPFIDGVAHLGGLLAGSLLALVSSRQRPSLWFTGLEALTVLLLLVIAFFALSL